jgi:hypothetical protein
MLAFNAVVTSYHVMQLRLLAVYLTENNFVGMTEGE